MSIIVKYKKAQMNPGATVATALTLILAVYVAYAMITAFVQNDPSFGRYGWPILAALVVGVIAFFKNGLLK